MRNRSRALAVLIAVLLAGCLLGVAGNRYFEMRNQKPSSNPVALLKKSTQERLAKILQMTTEQDARLKEILEDSRRQIDAVSAELDSKVEAIRSETNGQIAEILNEDQKARFQQMLDEAASHNHSTGRTRGNEDRGKRH